MLRTATRIFKAPIARGFQTRLASSQAPLPATKENLHYGSVDGYFEKVKIQKDFGEPNNRDFAYFVVGGARMAYASVARLMLIRVVASMAPSADVLALSSAEFKIDEIALGSTITVKWRGKPVFIKHRTPEEIATESAVPMSQLIDPQTDAERVQDPEWLVVIGVCTHLGCVPTKDAGDYGGWFCPCHGSHYDASGRIRRGPAPLNMEIPPYTLNDGILTVG